MTAPKREYARIYHDVVDDPDMATVYANDLAWSTWTKLLLIGDQAWPSSGMLPAGLSRPGLKVCVDAGAVVLDGHRFRVRGMDKERTGRSEKARKAANALHGGSGRSDGEDDDGMQPLPSGSANGVQPHPPSSANGVPSQAEPSKAEQSQAEQEQNARPLDGSLRDDDRIQEAMTEASGLHFPMPSRNGDRLLVMAKKTGCGDLVATIKRAAEDMGGYPDQSALVNTVANYLNPTITRSESPKDRDQREREAVVAKFRGVS